VLSQLGYRWCIVAQQKSKWFKTLEANGNIVQAWEVQRDHLGGWIANHMVELGLESNPKIAENIAYYTEGNFIDGVL
jgi:DNA polymerase-3 subunit delta